MTPLDAAHAEMQATDAEAARRAFWGVVAASELNLWLEAEPQGEGVAPRLFDIDGARYALAFDGEDRLAAFAGGPAQLVTLAGRQLAAMLAAEGLGLGLNFGAPSETLLPPEIVAWLAEMAAEAPRAASDRPVELASPALPQPLVTAIDRRLAAAEGLARRAWLARATWEDGRTSHLLAIEEALPGAAEPLARFLSEALAFAGGETELDVAPVQAGSALLARLERVALRFDLPEPPAPAPPDPKRPPRLR